MECSRQRGLLTSLQITQDHFEYINRCSTQQNEAAVWVFFPFQKRKKSVLVAERINWMNDHNEDDPQSIALSLDALVVIKSRG